MPTLRSSDNFIEEDKISVKEIVERVLSFIVYLWTNAIRIILVAVAIALLYFLYHTIRRPVYTAETTFVLQSASGSTDNISSLASVVGVNLGALSDASTLFQEDNILELYRSRKMIYETFLSRIVYQSDTIRLITYWANQRKLLSKWQNHLDDPSFSFEIPSSEFTVKHDSLLFEEIKGFKEKNLVASKPDRLLSILSVQIHAKDAFFAKTFNETLVERVNDFYLQTETKKTGENLEILSRQADSVRIVLERSMHDLAVINEEQPNLNPLYRQIRLPAKKVEIDLEASAVIYQEIVKNLEIAKITHRNSTPLIQIIDEPRFPLPSDKDHLLKRIALSIIIGGFLSVMFFSVRNIWHYIIKNY